ncbi:MAG: hypothetical protein ABDH91_09220, partial [Bacteroidia bacterium]
MLGSRFSHEKAAEIISGYTPPTDGPIRWADQVASAADRNAYLGASSVSWNESKPLLSHPLGGEGLRLPKELQNLIKKEVAEHFSTQLSSLVSPRLQKSRGKETFLWFWRFYFEEAAQVLAEQPEFSQTLKDKLKKYFPLFPADTR